jgi:hypothetical protein
MAPKTKKMPPLEEARARANLMRECLPNSVDVVSLGVREKAPFLVLCIREALIWRISILLADGEPSGPRPTLGAELEALPLHHPLFGGRSPSPALRERKG